MLLLPFRTEVDPHMRSRVNLLVALVSAAFLFLIGRLFFLQVIEGDRYTYLSENNRIRIKKVPGARGMVFDRKGALLVDNRPSFDLVFVPEDAEDPDATLKRLAHVLGRDENDFRNLVGENKMRPAFGEIVLGRDIDWRSVVTVEAHQLDLPGVTLWIRPRRSYLSSSMAAHVLGYIGEINSQQLKARRQRGYAMGDEIGHFGLEKKWEEYLRGQSGGQQVEVDALGRRVRVLHAVEDVPGQSVHLTLDRDLQETAAQALAGKDGAIVALDVNSGAILAMVSTPGFDPNVFARGVTGEEWRTLTQDPAHPLNNRAIQGQYPPGSTFKIVLAIAGLEEGVIRPETTFFCPGSLTVGNRVFRDWKKGGHGAVNLHKGLVESCDVYFYQLGQKLGPDRIAKYARALGLGQISNIELDHEKPGLIPDTQWKQRRFGQPWFPGETPSIAIGQGYVTVTPLQMANLIAAVANGGTLHRPWFVRKVESLDGRLVREYGPEVIRTLNLKEDTLEHIRKALGDVVNSGHGTGGRSKSNLVMIGGKTGTAQVAEMKGAIVKSEQLAYKIRDHAWFVAFAPVEKPEIAVAVLVEHGGHGGSAAAPMAKKIIERYFTLDGQPSPTEPRLASRVAAPYAD
ncbi:MAG: penicillin-binding protein 2 [Deltaproteobacteria bacterium]|nr:penicillin-binding protein 2 [Deltaproteobacteria bacterium]